MELIFNYDTFMFERVTQKNKILATFKLAGNKKLNFIQNDNGIFIETNNITNIEDFVLTDICWTCKFGKIIKQIFDNDYYNNLSDEQLYDVVKIKHKTINSTQVFVFGSHRDMLSFFGSLTEFTGNLILLGKQYSEGNND